MLLAFRISAGASMPNGVIEQNTTSWWRRASPTDDV